MTGWKSYVAAAAALTLLDGASAAVTRRWGTPAGPFCTDFTPFTYAGCFAEPSGGRALPFVSDISTSNMTPQTCVSFCKGNDYRYAGLEYYGECYCGASVAGVQIDESLCNFPCSGDSSQACGGNFILSVYQDPTFPAIDNSTTADYQSSGCYTDDVVARTLVYRQDALDAATLTVGECLAECKNGGYPLAGVEFAGECYCGVVLGNLTSQVDTALCNMPCNGDQTEICGGAALLNLYVATDLESRQPCTNFTSGSSSVSSQSSTTTSSQSSTLSSTTTTSTASSTSSSTSTTSTVSTTSSSTSTTHTTSTTSSCTSTTHTTSTTSSKPTTTTSMTTTKTTSVALCTTTSVPECEYSCGSWCSNPLPPFNSQSDCKIASSHCAIQISACFSYAQYPDSLKCFDFASWCQKVDSYCDSTCKPGQCSNNDCKSKNPLPSPPPAPSASVYTCSSHTTTATSSASKVPVPTPSNICVQPNNPNKGYTQDNPCGGIALPCLTCNNEKSDYDSGAHFKLYTAKDTSKCPSYKQPSISQGCKDACLAQYNSCVGTYAQACKSNNNNGPWGNNRQQDSYDTAMDKCSSQYQDCLNANSNVNPGNGRCSSWNSGW